MALGNTPVDNTLQEVNQLIKQRQEEAAAARQTISRFQPHIFQAGYQLARATPQSQARVQAVEVQREGAKLQAAQEIGQYEQGLQSYEKQFTDYLKTPSGIVQYAQEQSIIPSVKSVEKTQYVKGVPIGITEKTYTYTSPYGTTSYTGSDLNQQLGELSQSFYAPGGAKALVDYNKAGEVYLKEYKLPSGIIVSSATLNNQTALGKLPSAVQNELINVGLAEIPQIITKTYIPPTKIQMSPMESRISSQDISKSIGAALGTFGGYGREIVKSSTYAGIPFSSAKTMAVEVGTGRIAKDYGLNTRNANLEDHYFIKSPNGNYVDMGVMNSNLKGVTYIPASRLSLPPSEVRIPKKESWEEDMRRNVDTTMGTFMGRTAIPGAGRYGGISVSPTQFEINREIQKTQQQFSWLGDKASSLFAGGAGGGGAGARAGQVYIPPEMSISPTSLPERISYDISKTGVPTTWSGLGERFSGAPKFIGDVAAAPFVAIKLAFTTPIISSSDKPNVNAIYPASPYQKYLTTPLEKYGLSIPQSWEEAYARVFGRKGSEALAFGPKTVVNAWTDIWNRTNEVGGDIGNILRVGTVGQMPQTKTTMGGGTGEPAIPWTGTVPTQPPTPDFPGYTGTVPTTPTIPSQAIQVPTMAGFLNKEPLWYGGGYVASDLVKWYTLSAVPGVGKLINPFFAGTGLYNFFKGETPSEKALGLIQAGAGTYFTASDIKNANRILKNYGLTKNEITELGSIDLNSRRASELRLKALRNLEKQRETLTKNAVEDYGLLGGGNLQSKIKSIAIDTRVIQDVFAPKGDVLSPVTDLWAVRTGLSVKPSAGGGPVTPVTARTTFDTAGVKSLTKAQSELMAQDLVRTGQTRTITEARKLVLDISKGKMEFIPRYPTQIVGAKGEVSYLPSITTFNPPEIKSVDFFSVGKKTKKGTTQISWFNKGGRLEVSFIPSKSKYGVISPFVRSPRMTTSELGSLLPGAAKRLQLEAKGLKKLPDIFVEIKQQGKIKSPGGEGKDVRMYSTRYYQSEFGTGTKVGKYGFDKVIYQKTTPVQIKAEIRRGVPVAEQTFMEKIGYRGINTLGISAKAREFISVGSRIMGVDVSIGANLVGVGLKSEAGVGYSKYLQRTMGAGENIGGFGSAKFPPRKISTKQYPEFNIEAAWKSTPSQKDLVIAGDYAKNVIVKEINPRQFKFEKAVPEMKVVKPRVSAGPYASDITITSARGTKVLRLMPTPKAEEGWLSKAFKMNKKGYAGDIGGDILTFTEPELKAIAKMQTIPKLSPTTPSRLQFVTTKPLDVIPLRTKGSFGASKYALSDIDKIIINPKSSNVYVTGLKTEVDVDTGIRIAVTPPRSRFDLGLDTFTDTDTLTKISPLYKMDTLYRTKQMEKVKDLQKEQAALSLKTITKLETISKIKKRQQDKPQREITREQPGRKPPKKPPTFIPPIDEEELIKKFPLSKKKKPFKFQSFQVEVRKRGIFKPIGVPLAKGEALSLGLKSVKAGAAATFKLTPSIKKPSSIGLPKISESSLLEFRGPKRAVEPLTFIQRRAFRIMTPGEKIEIPGAGRKAIASRRKITW